MRKARKDCPWVTETHTFIHGELALLVEEKQYSLLKLSSPTPNAQEQRKGHLRVIQQESAVRWPHALRSHYHWTPWYPRFLIERVHENLEPSPSCLKPASLFQGGDSGMSPQPSFWGRAYVSSMRTWPSSVNATGPLLWMYEGKPSIHSVVFHTFIPPLGTQGPCLTYLTNRSSSCASRNIHFIFELEESLELLGQSLVINTIKWINKYSLLIRIMQWLNLKYTEVGLIVKANVIFIF